jgi:hypothetical protein
VVSARFTNARSGPRPHVNDPQCQALAGELVALILSGSAILDTFGPITRGPDLYPPYLRPIQSALNTCVSDPTGSLRGELSFYQHLEHAYQGYAAHPAEWVHALALVVEYTFLLLMQQKYPDPHQQIHHENLCAVIEGTDMYDTSPKPIDVIMWCNALQSGEFLEVKKALDNKRVRVTRGTDLKLIAKIETLYDLLRFLADHGVTKMNVGLATLSNNPYADNLVEEALRWVNKLGKDSPLTSLPYLFTIITSANLVEWYTKKVSWACLGLAYLQLRDCTVVELLLGTWDLAVSGQISKTLSSAASIVSISFLSSDSRTQPQYLRLTCCATARQSGQTLQMAKDITQKAQAAVPEHPPFGVLPRTVEPEPTV